MKRAEDDSRIWERTRELAMKAIVPSSESRIGDEGP